MSRINRYKTKFISPDPVYNNQLLHRIVNQLMKNGKKSLAYKMLYECINKLQENNPSIDPVKIIEQAVQNATPAVEIKVKRRGGATSQVPVQISPERATSFAIRQILSSCRNRVGKNMVSNLYTEFLDASQNVGNAIRKKNEIQKNATTNQFFSNSKKKF